MVQGWLTRTENVTQRESELERCRRARRLLLEQREENTELVRYAKSEHAAAECREERARKRLSPRVVVSGQYAGERNGRLRRTELSRRARRNKWFRRRVDPNRDLTSDATRGQCSPATANALAFAVHVRKFSGRDTGLSISESIVLSGDIDPLNRIPLESVGVDARWAITLSQQSARALRALYGLFTVERQNVDTVLTASSRSIQTGTERLFIRSPELESLVLEPNGGITQNHTRKSVE